MSSSAFLNFVWFRSDGIRLVHCTVNSVPGVGGGDGVIFVALFA